MPGSAPQLAGRSGRRAHRRRHAPPAGHPLRRRSFRHSDLLARLRGYTHRLPALRDRREDLGVVLADVLGRVAGPRASRLTLTPEAARALLGYAWPLNIRELHQAMGSAVALSTDDILDAKHLPAPRAPRLDPREPAPADSVRPLLRTTRSAIGSSRSSASTRGTSAPSPARWGKSAGAEFTAGMRRLSRIDVRT